MRSVTPLCLASLLLLPACASRPYTMGEPSVRQPETLAPSAWTLLQPGLALAAPGVGADTSRGAWVRWEFDRPQLGRPGDDVRTTVRVSSYAWTEARCTRRELRMSYRREFIDGAEGQRFPPQRTGWYSANGPTHLALLGGLCGRT